MTRPNDVFDDGLRFSMIPHELLTDPQVDAKAIALYAHLARFADWATGLAHPSRSTLARLMGYKQARSVDAILESLEAAGWIQRFARFTRVDELTGKREISFEGGEGWSRTSNGYVVNKIRQAGRLNTGPTPAPEDAPPLVPGDALPLVPEDALPQGSGLHRNDNQDNDNQKNNILSPTAEVGENEQPRRVDCPIPEGFTQWWAAYPRKVAKKAALKAYRAALRSGVTPSVLMEGLERSKRSWAARNTAQEYVPYPATWLNGGSWEDEEDGPAPSKARQFFEIGRRLAESGAPPTVDGELSIDWPSEQGALPW